MSNNFQSRTMPRVPLVVVQSPICVWLFATSWTAARQPSLSLTISWSLPTFMSIETVMPSSHLILSRPLLLLPTVFPSIMLFSSESTLCIRWPKYWSFSFSISPSSEYSRLISFIILISLQSKGLSRVFYSTSLKASILQRTLQEINAVPPMKIQICAFIWTVGFIEGLKTSISLDSCEQILWNDSYWSSKYSWETWQWRFYVRHQIVGHPNLPKSWSPLPSCSSPGTFSHLSSFWGQPG